MIVVVCYKSLRSLKKTPVQLLHNLPCLFLFGLFSRFLESSSSSDKEDIISSSERTERLSLLGEYVESASVSSAGESSSMILKNKQLVFLFQKKRQVTF